MEANLKDLVFKVTSEKVLTAFAVCMVIFVSTVSGIETDTVIELATVLSAGR